MNTKGDVYMNRIAFAVKSALGLAILAPPMLSYADTPSDNALQEIVVTGYRKSVEQSLEAKRAETNSIDVITAEDIGKMPDKNVADSLARVPGLTTSSSGANEGGFDENDRISMRGTNPSLTQTLINGHNVASGDWFVLDQTTDGRPQRQLYAAALGNRQQSRRRKELQRLAGRGRRRGFRRHHHAQAARLLPAVHARKHRRARCMRICRRRPTASSARSPIGRTTPTISASCCSCFPKHGTCGATASRCSATTP